MKKVKIPFNKIFVMEIAAGRKVATTRTKRYGKIGDYFYVGKNGKIRCKILSISNKQFKCFFACHYFSIL